MYKNQPVKISVYLIVNEKTVKIHAGCRFHSNMDFKSQEEKH